jgi:hypothetical protein
MQPQTASDLLQLRIIGKRPAGPVVITDSHKAAAHVRSAGLYSFPWVTGMPLQALRGLECVLYQSTPNGWKARADKIKKAGPAELRVIVRGFKWPELGIWQSY